MIVVNGMKSPYFFAKNMDKMAQEGHLNLSKAPNISSAVRMFMEGRASLMWGGEDFKWYMGKFDINAKYIFKPLFEKPVVVWVRKDKPKILARLDQAYQELKNTKTLNSKGLLREDLMADRYQDAPLDK